MHPAIEKIRKLFALSDNAGSPAEAEAALAKAKKLMLQYSISMSDVAVDPSRIGTCERVLGKQRCPRWKISLACVVADHFLCSVISFTEWNRRGVRFVGEGGDSEVAAFVFDYAERIITTLAQEVRASVRLSFASGCVTGVHRKLLRVFPREAEVAQTNALVVAKKAVVEAWTKANTDGVDRGGNGSVRDTTAYLQGVSAGYDIRLRVPVADGAGPAALPGQDERQGVAG